MSTVATTRVTITQHALASPPLPPPPPTIIAVSSSAITAPTTKTTHNPLAIHSNTSSPIFVEQLCALRRRRADMHPDCMLLQAHGVTSPRLSPGLTALSGEKHRRHSETLSLDMEREGADELDRCEEVDSADEMDVVGDDGEEGDGGTRGVASELKTKVNIIRGRHCNDVGDVDMEEDDDEAVSLCSEDSELSVGQEEGGSATTTSSTHMTSKFCDFTQQRRILLSNVGNMMALCAPSAFSSVSGVASACADGSDARSSASTDDTITQPADEESVGSSTGLTLQQAPLPPPSSMLDPYNVMASALRMPVPVMPPRVTTQTAPSPFQTELMRKSHLYAEELVKQQMQFMAAARASAFTLRGASAAETVAAAERRAFARVQSTSQQQMPNFAAGIQSQLTAITKMSQLSAAAAAAAVAVAAVANNNQSVPHAQHQQQQQHKTNLPNNTDALTKLGALASAHTHLTPNTASAVSSLSQLQAQMQAHFPYAHSGHALNNNNNNNNLNHNNNLNEPALKFSIDNILKADFGRRLAEGAACMAAYNNGTFAAKVGSGANNSNNTMHRTRKTLSTASSLNAPTGAGAANSPNAIDLTHLAAASTASSTAPSATTFNFSHTLANICTNSSDSNSTAVSSSYGGASEHAKSPASAAGVNSDFGVFGATKCPSSAATELSAKASDEANGSSSSKTTKCSGTGASGSGPIVWPAWVYCTRYSDRPSSGPRTRKPKKLAGEKGSSSGTSNGSGSGGSAAATAEDKRPRTAFSGSQLARLKHEFTENRYLTEKRRQQLSSELGLNEAQIKIWFQNKRAKLKKSSGTKNPLALQLMAQGLYNHSTVPLTREEEELQELQERENAAAAEVRNGGTTTTIST